MLFSSRLLTEFFLPLSGQALAPRLHSPCPTASCLPHGCAPPARRLCPTAAVSALHGPPSPSAPPLLLLTQLRRNSPFLVVWPQKNPRPACARVPPAAVCVCVRPPCLDPALKFGVEVGGKVRSPKTPLPALEDPKSSHLGPRVGGGRLRTRQSPTPFGGGGGGAESCPPSSSLQTQFSCF